MSLPETAVLITAHAALPANSSRENATAHRLRIVPAAASASLSAYCRAFSLPAAGAFGFCIALLTVQQFMDGYAEYVCNGG